MIDVAILGTLLSALANRLGSILQAIFGWSVTALFGRLPRKKQIAVSAALLLSLAWPVFVVGLVVPDVASWLLAFAPLEKWLGHTVLRVVWAVLAVTAPLGVGALVRWAAPSPQMSAMGAILYGYPLAIAFFASFLITAVTVPVVKLTTLAHGWSDEHVYVQPRPGEYDRTLRDLAEACARADLLPTVTDMPERMTIATRIMKTIGRRVAQPMIGDELRRLCADGVELYLYPSDLLVRGKPENISAVRAMSMLTSIDTHAYLVGSDDGQHIQDEIGRLDELVTEHHEHGHRVSGMAKKRVAEVWDEMNAAKLPFHEWTILETLVRRLERRLALQEVPRDAFAIERRDDGLKEQTA